MLAMLRLATEVGTAASWIFNFIAAVTAVFALYVGAAMYAVYHAGDPDQRNIRYKVFRDLLRFFGGWWRR